MTVDEIREKIAEEYDDPNSDINTIALLRDRAIGELGIAASSISREAIGSALLRAFWLGQGRPHDFVLSEPPALDNVLAMPGVDPEETASKVVPLDLITYIDLPAEKVLNWALDANLEHAFVIGYRRNGDFYKAGTMADGPELLWLLKLAEKELLEIGSGSKQETLG